MLVADLLRQNFFPDFKLVGGSTGLNREIASVSVIDAPDVDRWMRGGELLVGSGYIFKAEPNDLIPFMARAAEKNVAALGIKLDRYHHNLQDRIIETADTLGLPLMQIPLHYRWTDINEAVYRQLEQERAQRFSVQPETADTSDASPFAGAGRFWQEGLDAKRLLSQCASLIDRTIMVVSNTLGLNHIFRPGGDVDVPGSLDEHSLLAPVAEQRVLPSRGQVVARMEFRESPPAWQAVYNLTGSFPLTIRLFLTGVESTPSVSQERMLLRAISLLRATSFESEAFAPEGASRRERFFEGLCLDIYNDEGMIDANFGELKVALPRTSRIIIAVSGDDHPFEGWIPPEVPLSYRLGHFWTGLIPYHEHRDEREAKNFLAELKRDKGDAIFFALGGVIRSPIEISRSYQEANRTMGWVRSSGLPPGVYLHEELCLYALFDSLGRLPEAKSVWKRYWEPLLRTPETRKSLSRVELAEALISSDFNARLCSEKLHLHYNTVRNYIDNFETYLDVKIADQHHRLGITLAFYIDRYMHGK